MAGKASVENGKKGGRPKGSLNVARFADFVSDEDKAEFVEFMLATYKGDMNIARWVGDHLYAKPVQSVDHTTLGEKLPTPILGGATIKEDDETTTKSATT